MRSNPVGSAAEFRRRKGPVPHAFLRDVRVPAPRQPPIFRSRFQGELLARVLLGPEREVTMLDLAVMLRSDLGSVMSEVESLARAGIVALRRTLAGRVVVRDTSSPLYEPLAQLIMLTFGPATVVADVFGRLPAVREIYLFGPWAGRYNGVAGDPPGDVEVLVVGAIGPDAAFDAAQQATARLGLPVHPVVRTVVQWREDNDPFLREIRAAHLFQVTGPKWGDGMGLCWGAFQVDVQVNLGEGEQITHAADIGVPWRGSPVFSALTWLLAGDHDWGRVQCHNRNL